MVNNGIIKYYDCKGQPAQPYGFIKLVGINCNVHMYGGFKVKGADGEWRKL